MEAITMQLELISSTLYCVAGITFTDGGEC